MDSSHNLQIFWKVWPIICLSEGFVAIFCVTNAQSSTTTQAVSFTGTFPSFDTRMSSSHESPSSSSSASSLSSSSFWMAPAPSRWSPARYLPRNSVSKRQLAVISCLLLGLLIWVIPQPGTWRRQVIHITVQQPVSNPYQVLRPISPSAIAKKHTPDPMRWLEQNSNNKHAETSDLGLLKSVPSFGHRSAKPRAALISLVRNSELEGLMQSMRQLEYQWNRKYHYPWVFFNDEPFSDEFKVRDKPYKTHFTANIREDGYAEPHVWEVLLRSGSERALVTA